MKEMTLEEKVNYLMQKDIRKEFELLIKEVRNNPVNFGNRCYNDTSIKLQRKEI